MLFSGKKGVINYVQIYTNKVRICLLGCTHFKDSQMVGLWRLKIIPEK